MIRWSSVVWSKAAFQVGGWLCSTHSGTWDYDSHPQRVASKFTLVEAFLVSEERERTEFQSLRFALKQAKAKAAYIPSSHIY